MRRTWKQRTELTEPAECVHWIAFFPRHEHAIWTFWCIFPWTFIWWCSCCSCCFLFCFFLFCAWTDKFKEKRFKVVEVDDIGPQVHSLSHLLASPWISISEFQHFSSLNELMWIFPGLPDTMGGVPFDGRNNVQVNVVQRREIHGRHVYVSKLIVSMVKEPNCLPLFYKTRRVWTCLVR